MILSNADDLREAARKLAPSLRPGDVLLLRGDLGAGKTTFTQGLAQGLGIQTQVDSPTFVLIQSYTNGRLPLHHMDMYRINTEEEAWELGLDEYFEGKGVTVVEWPEQIPSFLPKDVLEVQLNIIPEGRELTYTPMGQCDILIREDTPDVISD